MFGNYIFGKLSQDNVNLKRYRTRGKLSFQDNADKIIQISKKDPDTGITLSEDIRLAVVKPTHSYMPTEDDVTIIKDCSSLSFIRSILSRFNGIMAVDIETNGTSAHRPDNYIVGIGMADANNIVYIDLESCSSKVIDYVYSWLNDYEGGLVGHNVMFDGTFIQAKAGNWLNWKFDTYGLYRQLAGEGHIGQTWGLKDAQIQLLNYDSKGDVKLDEWLVSNDYIADIKLDKKDGYVYVADYQDKGPRWCKPRKSEMFRAPAEILGYYCGVDAASTYQLLMECLLPSIKDQPYEQFILDYHEIFMDNVRLLASQQLTGITIDKPMLEKHHEYLLNQIKNHKDEFINHPMVRPIADLYNQQVIKELIDKEPVKFKKIKWPKEPKKFKKDGTLSKAWEKWEASTNLIKENGPEVTQHWIGWHAKLLDAKEKEHLNINSGPQMQWLFYEQLKFPIIMTTKSGQPSTGTDALPGFGEVGQLLKQQKDTVKEEGYVKGCLDHLLEDSEGNYRLHPQFRIPGTLTCRLAGSGGVNIQQIPKSRKYLDCWKPIEGKAWIDFDFTALEQVVLAELSRDESLLNLYGPGVPVSTLTTKLDKLGIKYTIENKEIIINDEDLHKL